MPTVLDPELGAAAMLWPHIFEASEKLTEQINMSLIKASRICLLSLQAWTVVARFRGVF